jgi:tripeptide aminopeptidase
MGVPTPNLFTGMQNIHGPLEWISLQDMARATELCVKLSELWAGGTSAGISASKAGLTRKGTDTASLVDWSG